MCEFKACHSPRGAETPLINGSCQAECLAPEGTPPSGRREGCSLPRSTPYLRSVQVSLPSRVRDPSVACERFLRMTGSVRDPSVAYERSLRMTGCVRDPSVAYERFLRKTTNDVMLPKGHRLRDGVRGVRCPEASLPSRVRDPSVACERSLRMTGCVRDPSVAYERFLRMT